RRPCISAGRMPTPCRWGGDTIFALSAGGNIRARAALVRAAFATVFLLVACKGPGKLTPRHDASVGFDAPTTTDSGGNTTGSAGGGGEVHPGLIEGAQCTAGTDCASGACVDGVCCNEECTGTCMTCAAVGSLGTCVPAEVGTDPRNECP